MTPATYRKGGKGAKITYAIADCPLGRLLVGTTERGIAAIYLGDDDAKLEKFLNTEYSAAHVTRDDGGLGQWMAPLLDHLAGRQPHLDLPLDVRAVATTGASNNVALAIPCHRVVRGAGSSGGHRWGVERKKALLNSERKAASGD